MKITEISFGTKSPDKDCKYCGGTGIWKLTDFDAVCVCTVDFNKKKEVEREAEVVVKRTKDGGAVISVK